MLHEGIIEKAATQRANLAEGVDTEKEFRLVAEVSNSETDAHFHIIMPKFLSKMEQTLNKKKTPFLLDHNIEQKIGKSVRGYSEGEDMKMRTMGEFGVPKDWNLKIDTNEFIKGVENGTLDAVSVGIRVKDVQCNIDNKPPPLTLYDLFMGDPKKFCFDHRPGRKYKNKVAKWLINDGSLSEVSSVYAGANYKAEIIDYTKMLLSQTEAYKDMTEDDLDNITPFMPEFSEIAKAYPSFAGSNKAFSFPFDMINPNPKTPTGGNDMDFEKELAKLHGQASAFMKELPDDAIKAMTKVIEECQTQLSEVGRLEGELKVAKAKADKFDEYYNARVAKAIEFGVIAKGEDFDKDKWEKIMKSYGDLSLVDVHHDEWEEEADEELPGQEGAQAQRPKPGDLKKKKSEEPKTFDDWDEF